MAQSGVPTCYTCFSHSTRHLNAMNLPFSSATRALLRQSSLLALTLGWLFYIWHRNYNLLGDFYDYSVMASGAGRLQEGLKPYRDFPTPLQSLPLYFAYLCERCLGAKYLSLAYANLLLGLSFFLVLVRLLRTELSFSLRLVVSAALCISTFFQHGIVWYNSIAIALATLVVILGARFASGRDGWLKTSALCVVLVLSGMTKINFHFIAVALAGLMLLGGWFARPGSFWTQRWKLVAIVLAGTVSGPLLEIAINGCSPTEFFENVVLLPAGRASNFAQLFNGQLYLGKVYDFYADNFSDGIFVHAFLLYVVVFIAFWMGMEGSRLSRIELVAVVFLPAAFVSSLALSVTNMETQMLTSAFLMVGLLGIAVFSRSEATIAQRRATHAVLFVLAGFFVIAGSASAYQHSRLRYGLGGWAMPGEIHRSEAVSARLNTYLGGVNLTPIADLRMRELDGFLVQHGIVGNTDKVYWCAGLEILNRVYGGLRGERLPLWYHQNVTVRSSDVPQISAELDRRRCEWVFTDWTRELPPELQNYFNRTYVRIDRKTFVAWHRRI